ncbi:MAG: sigma-70 family RNA polymerase sigma factor [Chitinophagaceae bacterium]
MQHPDQKYIDALLNNDVAVLEEIYKKFSGKIKWMVLQNNGSESDAADVFQDALLSVYNKAKTNNFILTCPFDAFIYLISRNKWLNELSKRKSHKVTITDFDGYNDIGEDSFKLADECRLHEERKYLLDEKVKELSENCQQLLRLSWSGKPMDEVAKKLGLTYGYARKKKSECMAQLVALIKQSSGFKSLKW